MMKNTLTLLTITILNIALCSLLILHDGAKWRIPDVRNYPDPAHMREEESSYCKGTDIVNEVALGSNPGEPLITCEYNIGADHDIYVWGDSHARHLLPGLHHSFPTSNIRVLYYSSCMSQNGIANFTQKYRDGAAKAQGCKKRNRDAITFFANHPPTSIIIHQYIGYNGQLSKNWNAATNKILDDLRSYGHKAVFLGGVIRPGIPLVDCIAVPALISNTQVQIRCRGSLEIVEKVIKINDHIEKEVTEHYIDTTSFFCANKNQCKWISDGELLFRDEHHLTVEGSRQLIDFIRHQLVNKLVIPG